MLYKKITNEEAIDFHANPETVPNCETHDWLKNSIIDMDPMTENSMALYCALCELEERLVIRKLERDRAREQGNQALLDRENRRIANFERRIAEINLLKEQHHNESN